MRVGRTEKARRLAEEFKQAMGIREVERGRTLVLFIRSLFCGTVVTAQCSVYKDEEGYYVVAVPGLGKRYYFRTAEELGRYIKSLWPFVRKVEVWDETCSEVLKVRYYRPRATVLAETI